MRYFFSSILGFIAIIISLPLMPLSLTNSKINSQNFLEKTLPEKLHHIAIKRSSSIILESETIKNFPQTIRENLTEEEIRTILNTYLTPAEISKIIQSIITQAAELKVESDNIATIKIPLGFIETNRSQIASDITEAIISDLPSCQTPDEFAPLKLNCNPENLYGTSTRQRISEIIAERHLSRISSNVPISFETDNPDEFSNLLNSIKNFTTNIAKYSLILLIAYIILTLLSGILVYPPTITAFSKITGIILYSALINILLSFSIITMTEKIITTDSVLSEITHETINAFTENIYIILIPIALLAIISKIGLYLRKKSQLESK